MLTKNMATEWSKHNIQVNGIGPGYFATSQTAPIRVDGHPFNDFIISRTPAGRWGNPKDLQGTAIFLASKASDFVSGQIVYVDGGDAAGRLFKRLRVVDQQARQQVNARTLRTCRVDGQERFAVGCPVERRRDVSHARFDIRSRLRLDRLAEKLVPCYFRLCIRLILRRL